MDDAMIQPAASSQSCSHTKYMEAPQIHLRAADAGNGDSLGNGGALAFLLREAEL